MINMCFLLHIFLFICALSMLLKLFNMLQISPAALTKMILNADFNNGKLSGIGWLFYFSGASQYYRVINFHTF
jgi:hypothetical protein